MFHTQRTSYAQVLTKDLSAPRHILGFCVGTVLVLGAHFILSIVGLEMGAEVDQVMGSLMGVDTKLALLLLKSLCIIVQVVHGLYQVLSRMT